MSVADSSGGTTPSSYLAFRNGAFLPLEGACLSPWDAGVVWGAVVTEQARTFGRRFGDLEPHWRRFRDGAARIGAAPDLSGLDRVADVLLAHHRERFSAVPEWSLVVMATPGIVPGYAPPGTPDVPTLIAQMVPTPFERYRPWLTRGAELDLAPATIPLPDIKHRSRLAWWLAERGHGGPLLYHDPATGLLLETAAANLVLVIGGEMLTPADGVLAGTALAQVERLAGSLSLGFRRTDLPLARLRDASEALLTNAAMGVMGVRRLGGAEYPFPGPVYRRLKQAWSDEAGADIHAGFGA